MPCAYGVVHLNCGKVTIWSLYIQENITTHVLNRGGLAVKSPLDN